MASLTETAYYTRRAINWGILAIIAYVILRALWGVFIIIFLAIFPPKLPPPNHAFGKLPPVQFPSPAASPSAQLSFKLETIEGAIPRASESATVYFMPKNAANLLALSKTQEFAGRLAFDTNPIQESKNIYRFNDAEFLLRKLRYDIVSDNFIIRYAFEQDTGLFGERNLPLLDAAQSEAKSILQTYNLYNDDIALGRSAVSYLKLSGDKLLETTSLSQADAVRVDFFRRPIGLVKIVTPNPDEGPISFMFSGSQNNKKRIVQFAYTFWPIDYETKATYALKSSAQAWQELQSGGGFIARYPKNGATTATVRNIYIGYYDSYDPQTYLQPIFTFEGDQGFLAYIPAVSQDWIE